MVTANYENCYHQNRPQQTSAYIMYTLGANNTNFSEFLDISRQSWSNPEDCADCLLQTRIKFTAQHQYILPSSSLHNTNTSYHQVHCTTPIHPTIKFTAQHQYILPSSSLHNTNTFYHQVHCTTPTHSTIKFTAQHRYILPSSSLHNTNTFYHQLQQSQLHRLHHLHVWW